MRPAVLLLLLAPLAHAAGEETWKGSGELGLAVSRGNASSENLNTKLDFVNEGRGFKHKLSASALRARGLVRGDFDGDGIDEERSRTTANRYALAATTNLDVNKRVYWLGALRHEHDDFAAFEQQSTASLGFGYRALLGEERSLSAEFGPGYRRSTRADGEGESDAIFRGALDYKQKLTANTTLANNLLVESGEANTFLQNDLGVSVAMNEQLALKAGIQLRHNNTVERGRERTDSLTTINLVYTIK